MAEKRWRRRGLFSGFCALLLAVLLAGPAAAQAAPQADSKVEATDQAVSVDPKARDDQIASRISRILAATGWFRGIDVSVSNGVVFLDGVAKTAEQRDWARNLAAKTQDVVAVVNRIKVDRSVSWSFQPAMDELRVLARDTVLVIPFLVLAALILPLAWYASALTARLVRWVLRDPDRPAFLTEVIARAVSIPIFLLGLYIVLQVAGLTQLALSVIGGAGVIGIVVGFAFRDIAENFLASLLLSIRQPFRSGDYINVGGQEGTVDSMNTRSTVLVSLEGNHIQIPNATIFKSTIVNFTASPTRRATLDVGIGYDVSIADAQEIIHDVLIAHEAVLGDPKPLVLVDGLGASTVNIKAYYWMNGARYSVLKVRSALLRLIKRALIREGITMPDDAREIIFPDGVPITGLPEPEGAPAAPPVPKRLSDIEPEQSATEAEGDLENEAREIEEQARGGILGDESDGNLLNEDAASEAGPGKP